MKDTSARKVGESVRMWGGADWYV